MGSSPVGTQIFSLSHARDMLNIPSFLKFHILPEKTSRKKLKKVYHLYSE